MAMAVESLIANMEVAAEMDIAANEDGKPAVHKIKQLVEVEDKVSQSVLHRELLEQLAQKGNPIEPLPFAGAVYILAHGENWLPENINKFVLPQQIIPRLKKMFFFRPLTSSIKNEFGIYDINQRLNTTSKVPRKA